MLFLFLNHKLILSLIFREIKTGFFWLERSCDHNREEDSPLLVVVVVSLEIYFLFRSRMLMRNVRVNKQTKLQLFLL
jgi:hypothetical protein